MCLKVFVQVYCGVVRPRKSRAMLAIVIIVRAKSLAALASVDLAEHACQRIVFSATGTISLFFNLSPS